MNRPDIDLVFGRGRLRMATGHHVEVFREESQPGERRRYSKRFLVTQAGDLRHWTEREVHILTRLAGLGIAPMALVEPFDHGAYGRLELLRTYDAGVTVDHWATLLPVQRDGTRYRHVFEDCAHWWALARHCLMALDTLHEAGVVHLDLKADNICIPLDPEGFDPAVPGEVMKPRFEELAFIDFAFSLILDEGLIQPLPLAGQTEYEYQSPRLFNALEAGRKGDLTATRQLDWRCDVFSLAAMLRRYLPGPEASPQGTWTLWQLEQARALIRRLLEAHDADEPAQRPHQALIALTKQALADAEVSASLKRGWTLDADGAAPASDLATPLTRVALPASTGLPIPEPEMAAEAHFAARPAARRAAWTQGWITVAAIGVPLLGTWWWAMQPRPSTDSRADAALRAPAEAASTAALPPAPRAASVPALSPPPPTTAPATTPASPPAAVVATSPPTGPAEMDPAMAPPPAKAVVPATPPAVAPPERATTAPPKPSNVVATPKPVEARTRAATRSRATTRTPAVAAAPEDRLPVNQAERERALEFLNKRGPSPQPGMTMPPAPAPVSVPASTPPKPSRASPRP